MSSPHYYSVRMHASASARHVSGAERIIEHNNIDQAVSEMVRRAFSKKDAPSTVSITIDDLGSDPPRSIPALPLTSLHAESALQGRELAIQMLCRAGVSESAARQAVELLSRGPAAGNQNMRGAMILDAATAERLEPDKDRGVRASRFDWSPEAEAEIQSLLLARGLAHFRTKEALALATKVAHGPGVVAELCWSDDPDYSAGYVASQEGGYIRISPLKQPGDDRGGRAIFVQTPSVHLEQLIPYLEKEAILIGSPETTLLTDHEQREKGAVTALFDAELAFLEKKDLLRQLSCVQDYDGSHVVSKGKTLLLMCSNDYLGLSIHPALKQAAAKAAERYGTGAGASRLVSGTGQYHEELEHATARFKGTESALLFNSGYAANTGIIPSLAGEGDVILSDSLNHASIIDGCRLSRAALEVYQHGDCNHLEDLLRKHAPARRRLIITDSVFSMDGDIAPLPDIAVLAEKYGALLMVDDAHATGVLGTTGRGSSEHFALTNRVHVQMGTFGKALGSFGAYAAGSRSLIQYLLNKSRSFMFSTALPASVCAASQAALDLVDREPDRRRQLMKNRERFQQGLASINITVPWSPTAIIPIICGSSARALSISRALMEAGIFASAIRPPTVPEGTARIRMTVLATHSDQDIDRAIEVLEEVKNNGFF